MIILKIIIAFFVFNVIAFVHELGHFLTAKKFGVMVYEFEIGMGPKLISKKKGETTYFLRVLPFGGYCKMAGENEEIGNPRSFHTKSVLKRMLIVVAGAFMNLLLGLVLLLVITLGFGEKLPTNTVDNAAGAEKLQVGDTILKIGGTKVFTTADIRFQILISETDTFDLIVRRNGKKIEINDVKFNSWADCYFSLEDKTFLNIISYSFRSEAACIQQVFIALRGVITGNIELGRMGEFVAKTMGNGAKIGKDFYEILYITVFLSINAGLFSLLPIPTLDGGYFVFLLIEAIRRKKFPTGVEG